jgi:hypothetical protein
MDDNTPQNGHGNGKIYVKFGPGDTDEMPREWAEEMLAGWREAHPAQFGKALAEVVIRGR